MAQELDPFVYFPDYSSAIKPLGGLQPGPDPKYAFHTLYLPFRPGPVSFVVNFIDLAVTAGEMTIQINAYIPDGGATARLATSTRANLPAMLERGEQAVNLRINAVEGVHYALYGHFHGETDANAQALSILAEESEADDDGRHPDALLPTAFKGEKIGLTSRLVSRDLPTFSDPVSQVLTEAQLQEPSFLTLREQLPGELVGDDHGWRAAFILRTLQRYGLQKTGVRGFGFEGDDRLMAGYLRSLGFDVSTVHPQAVEDQQSSDVYKKLLDSPEFKGDQLGFDFLYSLNVNHRFESASEIFRFCEDSIGALRRGGLAIHMFDVWPVHEAPASITDGMETVDRRRIEQLALRMIARGFEVAQLNFAIGVDKFPLFSMGLTPMRPIDSVPFGLIARNRS